MRLFMRILSRCVKSSSIGQSLCTGAKPSGSRLQLFDQPKLVMPTIPAFSLNFNLLVYRWRYDRSFNKKEFFDGAKMALLVMTKKLHDKETEGLMSLVTKSLGSKLVERLETFTEDQRKLLNLESDDVLFFFMKSFEFSPDGQESQFAQTMLVAHCLYNSKVLKASVKPQRNPTESEMQKFAENIVLANMRLSKQVYPEVAEDWTCDQFNLFQPEKFSIGGKII